MLNTGAPISITGIFNFDADIGPIVVPPLKSERLTNSWQGTCALSHIALNIAAA